MKQRANLQPKMGSALSMASAAGHLKTVQYLLEQVADLHVVKALRFAAANGHLPVVQYLVAQGADLVVGYAAAKSSKRHQVLEWLEGTRRARQEALLLEASFMPLAKC